MPERPIKKSERQANSAADVTTPPSEQDQAATSSPVEVSQSPSEGSKPSSAPRPVKKGDAPRPTSEKRETSDKREKRSDRTERGERGRKSEAVEAAPTNLALMRGPKPPKSSPKPLVEETPAEETSDPEAE